MPTTHNYSVEELENMRRSIRVLYFSDDLSIHKMSEYEKRMVVEHMIQTYIAQNITEYDLMTRFRQTIDEDRNKDGPIPEGS